MYTALKQFESPPIQATTRTGPALMPILTRTLVVCGSVSIGLGGGVSGNSETTDLRGDISGQHRVSPSRDISHRQDTNLP